ncbi:MAG: bifunctional demethylmenaquinone methyltransferase/2-methoxy-6-polyprenyl-1,4-benzoquinol methylase UbiE [Planctomycetes bacterium]|nr:bifunctional demethylmenaquinone methyltransferase/2-methoxy-6-polyprenyl-1,4-benzoquinol methylase UbiE [Planctomycetota bacterium]
MALPKAPTDMGTAPASKREKAAWDDQTLQGDPHRRDDKAQRVQAMFTAIAHAYDINNRLHSLGLDQSWRRRTVRLVEPIPGSRVLDVACGTGDLTEAFARAGAAEVIGLDYTAAMLDHARMKAAKAGGTVANIRYLQGDAQSLPFADASFDIVSIAFGIRNVADPSKALAEFRRVLTPGGRLAILEFSRPKAGLVRFVSDLYTQRIMPWTASLIARDGSGAYHYLPKSVETFLDPSALSTQLCSAGFVHVTAHPMTMNTCTALIGRVVS